jgi:exopolyphosphatase/guanosine-5'-triphosphate,3'-diphosphate pyrophosphatase
MIAGAIDIGTNTTLALLAEGNGRDLKVIHDQITVNHLGDALREGPVFSQDVIALNVDLLAEIVRDYRRMGAENFVIGGTAAMRRATNRSDFQQAVLGVIGLPLEVINGRDEAALTYLGAISNREIYPGEHVCVMDLGGGSTEIVEGYGYQPGQSYSIDVGSSYLTNEYFADDPPGEVETDTMVSELRGRLPQLVVPLRGTKAPWILVGGTAVTLAMLKGGHRVYDPARVGGATLTVEDVDRLIARFRGRHNEELQTLPGMPVGRGRLILAGAILLREMFWALEIEEGTVSERGLRHGLWLAKFGRTATA